MAAITCDIPVIIDGYESARARQRYLIEKMEALDMTLWMARIPSATKFHYPAKLDRMDDDRMEMEILDIMQEIEGIQGILDIYEDVEDAVEVEEEEQEKARIEMLTRGRQPSLCVPIPSGSFSRNPSPCSKAIEAVAPEPVRTFNPFREEFYLGLEEPITDDTEFLAVPQKQSRPISTISNNSLFGDIVEFVKGWNPFELGSAGTSRRSSTESTISINEMISDSSVSSTSDDECMSIRKTSRESGRSCSTDITVPLILDNGSLECFGTRKSSISSDCPWRDYLEYAVEEEYDNCEGLLHEIIIEPSNQDKIGRSHTNTTTEDITSHNIIYTERELSASALSLASSEPQIIQIELPAYEEEYQSPRKDSDQHIRAKLLDSTADLKQLPSLESVLSNLYPSFRPSPDAHLPRCGGSLSLDAMLSTKPTPSTTAAAEAVDDKNNSFLKPPKTLHHMSSIESITYGKEHPVEILEARRMTIVHVRTFSL